jgi:hypothetical protein
MDQLEANTSLHNLPSAYLLKGQLSVEALEYGINEVLRRHASLRTYFTTAEDGTPAQRIAPPRRSTCRNVTCANCLKWNARLKRGA